MNINIPNGWEIKKISDISDINPGKSKTIIRSDKDSVSFIPMEAVDETRGLATTVYERPYEEVKNGYIYFEKGDIIFAKITPCMQNGKSAIVENLIGGFGFGSTEFIVLRAKPGISNKWLLHFLRTAEFRKDAEDHFTGSAGQQRVSTDFVSNHLIPYPTDPKIVDQLLLALNEKIITSQNIREAAQKQEEAVSLLQNSILNEFFPYKKGKKLPDGWKWIPLDKAVTLKSGSTVSKSDEKSNGDLPYIRVSDMNSDGNSEEVTSSVNYVRKTGKVIQQIIPSNSVIFPKRGGAIATNKKRLVKKEILADSNIMAAICNQGVDVDYFFTWFQMINLENLASGSSVPQINNPDLYKLYIPTPVDVAEQIKVVSRLKNMFEKTKQTKLIINKQLEAIEALPSAILRQAFAFN